MKALAALLTLLLSGVLVFVLWPAEEAEAGAGAPLAVSPSTRRAQPGEDGAVLVGPAAGAARTGRDATDTGFVPVEAPDEVAPWGFFEGEASQVLVLRAGERTPVAGAVVHMRSENDRKSKQDEATRLWREDLDLYLARYTERFAANAEGIALVPKGRRGIIYAVAPGLVGMASYRERKDEVFELEVHPDRTLVVHVQGPNGVLADVDVGLATKQDRRGRSYLMNTRRSDAEGRAVFKHLAALVRTPWNRGKSEFVARLEIPLAEPVLTDLPSLDELEQSEQLVHELVLEAPATGSVVVRVVGTDGEHFPTTGSALLVQLSADLDQRLQKLNGDVTRLLREAKSPLVRELASGTARFAHVGIGLDLGVLTLFEEERDASAELLRGPIIGGSLVEVELTVGPVATVLAGRLVDADGLVLAEREFVADVAHADGKRNWRESTDAEGNFRLRFEPNEVPGGQWNLSIRPSAAEAPESDPATEAQTEAEDPAGLEGFYETLFEPLQGENALGDLVCSARPLLVAGRVVDENGDGLDEIDVTVGLQLKSDVDPSRDRFWEGADLTPGADRTVQSDAEGDFRMYGRVGDVNRWTGWTALPAVQASGEGITNAEAVMFQQGEEGVELEVLIAGSIEGTLGIDIVELLDHLRISVQRGAPGEIERRWINRQGKDFSAVNLRPGKWDLVLELEEEGGEILRVPGIQVPRGDVAEDARLDPVDLSMMKGYRIDVASATGSPLDTVSMQRRLPGALDWGNVQRVSLSRGDEGRYFELVTAQAGLDLQLAAAGHRAQELTNVIDDRSILLDSGILVELSVAPDLLRLLGDDTELHAQLQTDGLEGRQRFGTFTPNNARVTRRVSVEGTYGVRAWIYAKEEGSTNRSRRRSRRMLQSVAVQQTVSVSEDAAPIRVRLALEQEAFESALERLRAILAERQR